jgi:hypothetical protein
VPRYFFHIRDGDELIEDFEGSEFPDLETAKAEALETALDIIAERVRSSVDLDGRAFEIADEDGIVLAVIPLREMLRQ